MTQTHGIRNHEAIGALVADGHVDPGRDGIVPDEGEATARRCWQRTLVDENCCRSRGVDSDGVARIARAIRRSRICCVDADHMGGGARVKEVTDGSGKKANESSSGR